MHPLVSKLPKRVMVGYWQFKVVPVEPEHPILVDSENETVSHGVCELDTQEIFINQELNLLRFVNVVLHELLHAINWTKELTDESTEEQFTAKGADGLTELMLDNPKLERWFARAHKEIREIRNGREVSDQPPLHNLGPTKPAGR